MIKRPLFVLLPLLMTACTPAAMEGLGKGLAQGAVQAHTEATAPTSAGLTCSGTTSGTLTQARATLDLVVGADGEALGTFTNNGTGFAAQGRAATRVMGGSLMVSAVSVSLDSSVAGFAALQAKMGYRSPGVGGGLGYGSTGTLSGTLSGTSFTGTFKGLQGTYRAALTCTLT